MVAARRGVARRSFARRRTRRFKGKWDWQVIPLRFKMWHPQMKEELNIELFVLDQLEKGCFTVLQSLGVDTALWVYYVGYAKRLWERGLKFNSVTYGLERTSLQNEYVARGLDLAVLEALDPPVEEAIAAKRALAKPVWPPVWSYDDGPAPPIGLALPEGLSGGYYNDGPAPPVGLATPEGLSGGYYDDRA